MDTDKKKNSKLNQYEKRFLLLMKLIKIDQMLKKATITHTPMKS